MPQHLWDKGGAVDAGMLQYTARDDWQLDRRLLPYDLRATLAHVHGLERIGVLSAAERTALDGAIAELSARCEHGELVVEPRHEDGHTAIEEALVATLGDLGKKVHTGRSRNDQVLVALRLWERAAIDELSEAARAAALALVEVAEREAKTPMPGYTHLQRAVPSSVGLWLGAIAEGLCESRELLAGVRAVVDRSPLGAAAGYGVNLPLDRDGVARELGFAAVADNTLASQSSRGMLEVPLLGAAWHATAVVRRFAWDVSLYTTSEFGFVTLDEALTTGSSIMPQKRNPDVVELMRAAGSVVEGAMVELMRIVAVPSGYHRDLQLTKAPLFRGVDEALATVRMLPRVARGMRFDRERMRAAITPECFATDRAVELAASGVPFRDAYRQVAAEVSRLSSGDADASLRARVSPGSPGDPGIARLRQRLLT
jgi:argininosuccinate lyase